jgi:hypothetical protein
MLSKSQKANILYQFSRLDNRLQYEFTKLRFLPTKRKIETLEIQLQKIKLDLGGLPVADNIIYDKSNLTFYFYWKSDGIQFKKLIMFLHFNSH